MCLHGYRQNAVKFSSQTGSLRKILKNEVEFHYLSAPHLLPDTEVAEGEDEEQRAWWFTKPNSFSSRDVTDLDKGFKESLEEIKKFVEKNGPFDGILGFSQGACLAGLLCALKTIGEIDIDFRFAIIVSGFKSNCILHSKYYDQKIYINSLHVIGETDQIITTDMCHDLANVFVNPIILTHPGGHFVPGKSLYRNQYVDFLQRQKTT